ILDEIAKQPGLAFRESDLRSIEDQFGLTEIHAPAGELIVGDLLLFAANVTYQLRLDPDLQFIEFDRLDQTIICTGFEDSESMPALIARRKHHDRRVEIAPAQIGTNVHRTDTVFGMVNKNKVEVIGKTRIRNNFKLGSGSDRIAAASECFHHWSHGVNVVPDQEQMKIHLAFYPHP